MDDAHPFGRWDLDVSRRCIDDHAILEDDDGEMLVIKVAHPLGIFMLNGKCGVLLDDRCR